MYKSLIVMTLLLFSTFVNSKGCHDSLDDNGDYWLKGNYRKQSGGWLWFRGSFLAKNSKDSSEKATLASLKLVNQECGVIPESAAIREACTELVGGEYKSYKRVGMKISDCNKTSRINTHLTDLYYILSDSELFKECSTATSCFEDFKNSFNENSLLKINRNGRKVCSLSTSLCIEVLAHYEKLSMYKSVIETSNHLCEVTTKRRSKKYFCSRAPIYQWLLGHVENSKSELQRYCFRDSSYDHCKTLLILSLSGKISIREALRNLSKICNKSSQKSLISLKISCVKHKNLLKAKDLFSGKASLPESSESALSLVRLVKRFYRSDSKEFLTMFCFTSNEALFCDLLGDVLSEEAGFTSSKVKQAYLRYIDSVGYICTDLRSCMSLAWYLTKVGQYKRATSIYRKYSQSVVSDKRIANNYAKLLEKKGREDEAMKLYEFSCSREGLYGCYNLAAIYSGRGLHDYAMKFLSLSTKLGYNHKKWILNDSRFDGIKSRPDFVRLFGGKLE